MKSHLSRQNKTLPPSRCEKWLEEKNCYVFTINGFPYGNFHGERVKEQVYRPDWSNPDRLEYTVLLFEILEKLLQPGEEGSVSTLPGSFKEFHSAGEIPKLVCFFTAEFFFVIGVPLPGGMSYCRLICPMGYFVLLLVRIKRKWSKNNTLSPHS